MHASTPADLSTTLSGVHAALITPFQADGSLKLDVVPDLIALELSQGIDGFYVGGSTGEQFLQSAAERADFLRAVADAARGRTRLIAHIGAISTAETLALGRVAAESGYDAVSALPPFYFDFSRADVIGHYKRVAAEVPLPLIVYNFPAKTPTPLSTAELFDLLETPNIAGVKHTSQNLYQLERLKQRYPGKLVYSGFDEMFVGGMAMGADGGIGTTFNVMGRLFADMYAAMRQGDLSRAVRLQTRANHVIDVMVAVGVFPTTKAMLTLQGVDVGPCRAPLPASLTPEQQAQVERCMAEWLTQPERQAAE